MINFKHIKFATTTLMITLLFIIHVSHQQKIQRKELEFRQSEMEAATWT